MDKKIVIDTGIGPVSSLGVAFVVLKLCGVIDWSWWWVLSPYWIGGSILATVLIVLGVIIYVLYRRDKKESNYGT